jgi:FixJ family two-component response regulator
VKAHRGQVMRKMKAESFADLIRMAARLRSELALLAPRSVQIAV